MASSSRRRPVKFELGPESDSSPEPDSRPGQDSRPEPGMNPKKPNWIQTFVYYIWGGGRRLDSPASFHNRNDKRDLRDEFPFESSYEDMLKLSNRITMGIECFGSQASNDKWDASIKHLRRLSDGIRDCARTLEEKRHLSFPQYLTLASLSQAGYRESKTVLGHWILTHSEVQLLESIGQTAFTVCQLALTNYVLYYLDGPAGERPVDELVQEATAYCKNQNMRTLAHLFATSVGRLALLKIPWFSEDECDIIMKTAGQMKRSVEELDATLLDRPVQVFKM
ncbi:hypothetical protein EJ04DRAFT_164323 [Polyplosphaeria fusca]|uniref:Uncharacterized protein n=1 Tax=Polyplosphaeria fusca TaxID=682080 RepID=A0A9P4R9T3_9PLEO|nr:hypothetical protein EJ04DRAFT_164323 [Polyplosphaeria fusca]